MLTDTCKQTRKAIVSNNLYSAGGEGLMLQNVSGHETVDLPFEPKSKWQSMEAIWHPKEEAIQQCAFSWKRCGCSLLR